MAYTDIDKPSDYFNTLIWTGNGASSRAISGLGFQPDWSWFKERSGAEDHMLFDSVRGATKRLNSNTTAAETDSGADRRLLSFDSDGFTIGLDLGINGNTETYVGWNWKAGTSVSGNTTQGGGTAKAYSGSVNTTSGFSIITYLGNGTAGHAIPHNLGVTPEIIITKRLSDAGEWYVYSPVMGNTKHMRLNQTGAEDTANTIWNNTSPTSSVFTVGTNVDMNTNNDPVIAYSFNSVQGFSKMGEYTGNGNADGPFIYTGFKPAFVMIKRTVGGTDNWVMYDNKRSPFNEANENLAANASSTTNTGIKIDMLSNGFKCRVTEGNTNVSGNTYTYMAFAENPFVASNYNVATAR